LATLILIPVEGTLMRIEIMKDRNNPLLDRREIEFRIMHNGEGTPSRADVCKELAKRLNIEEDKIFIPHIKTETGRGVTRGFALIFMNGIKLSQIEPRYRKKLRGSKGGEEKPEKKS